MNKDRPTCLWLSGNSRVVFPSRLCLVSSSVDPSPCYLPRLYCSEARKDVTGAQSHVFPQEPELPYFSEGCVFLSRTDLKCSKKEVFLSRIREVTTTKYPLLGNLVLLRKGKKENSLGHRRQHHERNTFLLSETLGDSWWKPSSRPSDKEAQHISQPQDLEACQAACDQTRKTASGLTAWVLDSSRFGDHFVRSHFGWSTCLSHILTAWLGVNNLIS